MEKIGGNFNKIKNEIQPELDLNFEVIDKTSETPTDDEGNLEKKHEAEIPSADELEKLKETDFEDYLYWVDRIIEIDQKKHEHETEEVGRQEEINRQKELDDLYGYETKEEKREAQSKGQYN